MPAVSNLRANLQLNLQKSLLALLVLALAALNAGSSGGIRYGGDEDEGSGFGGTGRMPTGGSGLGGTGFKPFLGDAGEVQIRYEPDAVVISQQVREEEIERIPESGTILPPVAVVTMSDFAAEHTAEVAITDSIQMQLQRDTVIYDRILESVEGYYPPETGFSSTRTSAPELTPERQEETLEVAAEDTAELAPAVVSGEDAFSAPAPDPARITWAELASFLAENGPAPEPNETHSAEIEAVPASVQRPDRIRRPELPQVQRGRVIRRPAILPPRVQPMRF